MNTVFISSRIAGRPEIKPGAGSFLHLPAPSRFNGTPRQAFKGADTKRCRMSNPKKINLAALLEEDAAPANPQICFELECGNFAQPDDEYCVAHSKTKNRCFICDRMGCKEHAVPMPARVVVEDEDNPVRKWNPICRECGVRPKRSDTSDCCQECWDTNHKPKIQARLAQIAQTKKEWNETSCAATAAIRAKELSSDIGKSDVPATTIATSEASGGALEFPEDCMYGEAKLLARQMQVPLGLAYPAILGCWSVKPDHDKMCGTRVNLTVALCAPVGGGKNVAMDRAQRLLGLVKDAEYKKAAPAGTRALMSLLGDKPSGKRGEKTRTPGPRKMLLITHEMTDVLKMTGVDNSTLASRLCDFWDDNEFEYPIKEGIISVNCRLSWVGGVPCSVDNPTRFTELFSSETSHGLYDRLLFGYSDVNFNYREWDPPSATPTAVDFDDYAANVPRIPRATSISDEARRIYDAWQPKGGGSRIKQNCMKVALITTMMNDEDVVTEQCMRCAIKFMEWQIAIRSVFEPGEAVNDSARCRTVILQAMERKGAKEKSINVKRLAHDRKWGDRFGDWLVKSVIQNLADMGEIVPQIEEILDKNGNVVKEEKSKSMFKLRDFSK